ncbi:MAG TPA: MXAN_6640 family putative metalloprotease, partial [Actinomycetota bacterium]|nr:MXAN_6640 family putative metalloprotease [Actinomycetota bacterium]
MLSALLAAPIATASDRHPLPGLPAAAGDALTRALAHGELSEAQYALERARSLFRLGAVRARFGAVQRPGPRDATMILRDLALVLPQFRASERRAAEGLLARPEDGASDPYGDGYTVASHRQCGTNVCIHWVESTADAPPGADGDGATVPAWVNTTQAVVEDVWQQEVVDFGYRAPLSDSDTSGQGGTADDAKFDVYLANLGDDRLFGYCATDDPDAFTEGPYYDVSAYCVLDNDYAEFGLDPLDILGVTTAHEFFHAVQYAYDFTEDVWFLESLSTWIEDELAANATIGIDYDAVNDNVNYLAASPLTYPTVPLDRGPRIDPNDPFRYGGWIFWRFLADRLFADRTAVRDVLERADASAVAIDVGRDEYSTQALARYLASRSRPFRLAFANFALVNRLRLYADEGSEAAYPIPPLSAKYSIGRTAPSTRWRAPRLRHLASRDYAFKPSKSAR